MNQTEKNLFRIRQYNKALDAWKEDEHPRDKNGRFKKGEGESKADEVEPIGKPIEIGKLFKETPKMQKSMQPKNIKTSQVLNTLANIFGAVKNKAFPPNTKNIISKNSKLGKEIAKYGKEHLEHVNGILEQAPKSFLTCWRKVEDKLVLRSGDIPNPDDSQYYNHAVEMNFEADAKGNMYLYPHETFFHEFGHNMDAALGYAGKAYSEIYKDGAFGECLMEEANNILDPIRAAWREKRPYADDNYIEGQSCKELEEYFLGLVEGSQYSFREISAVLDIFCGCTKGRFRLGAGHTEIYYTGDELMPMEAFADMCTSLTSSPERVRIYQKWFPKSYAMYLQMIEEVGGATWTNRKISKGRKR